MSVVAPIAYHQHTFAVWKSGFAARAVSHSFSPWTSRLCWRHRKTSPSSRKYQPLPTIPCSFGILPARNVDCTLHVTAGSTVPSSACQPSRASAEMFGMCRNSFGVMPTTSSTNSGDSVTALIRGDLLPSVRRRFPRPSPAVSSNSSKLEQVGRGPAELRGDAPDQCRVAAVAGGFRQDAPRVGLYLNVRHVVHSGSQGLDRGAQHVGRRRQRRG